MHFSDQVAHTLDGLLRVRFLPNGRIDFLSVNEMVRLQANMTSQFDEEAPERMQKENETSEQEGHIKSSNESNR
jgi:hypothetical protein